MIDLKCLNRNLTSFYYCLYEGEEEIKGAENYNTGEYKSTYSAPVKARANISPASGYNAVELFGNSERYDKIIVTDDVSCPINENAVLFIGVEPTFTQEGTPKFNYIVKRVAKSLNAVSIAVKEVKLS